MTRDQDAAARTARARSRRAAAAGVIAALLCVAVAGAASGAIVPGVGIAGLKLGVSAARARQVLGKPIVQKNQGEENWFYVHGPVGWVTIKVKGTTKTVEGIETRDRKQRTPRGVGVGSSLSALRKAYPKLTCKKGWLGVPFRSCWIVTSIRHQKISTNFVLFKSGRVAIVDIGTIGEDNLAPQS